MNDEALRAAVEDLGRTVRAADGSSVQAVSGADLSVLAGTFRISLRDAEIAALHAGVRPERYLRNFQAYSVDEQIRLLRAKIVVVGLGGLGGYVLEFSARTGIGRIIGADGDVFEESNLNRQLFAEGRTMGEPKAETAARRVPAVNPAVEFTACSEFLDRDAMVRVLDGADAAADCLGGLDDRPALRAACAEKGVVLVTAAVAGTVGSVETILPGEPSMADMLSQAGGRAAEDVLGTQAPPVASAASIQAQEIINVILGRPVLSGGKALIFDLADMTFEKVGL